MWYLTHIEVIILFVHIDTYCIRFAMQDLIANATLFVISIHLFPDIWRFVFVKMAYGGHFVYTLVKPRSGCPILVDFWYVLSLTLSKQNIQKNLLLQFFWGGCRQIPHSDPTISLHSVIRGGQSSWKILLGTSQEPQCGL